MVYPKIDSDTYWSFSNSLSFINKKSAMPPLGLITLASMVKEYDSSYNIKLVDENVTKLRNKDLKWADIVMTSSMIVQSESLDDVITRARKYNNIIVAGGPHPTQFYDTISGVDHFVLGEAESNVLEGSRAGVLVSFLDDLAKGEAKKAYARIKFRKKENEYGIDIGEYHKLISHFGDNKDITISVSRPDINSSPVPMYELLDMGAYGSMAIQFSRGCPMSCEFCNEPTLFGHRPRVKNAENFVSELQKIYDLGYNGSVFIVDDNFIGNIKEAKNVLSEIKKFQERNDNPFRFYTEASLNLSSNDSLMESMRDAGFSMVFVGIESPDSDVLEGVGKYVNSKRNLADSVKKIQSYGMEVTAGMIVGMDKEPFDICDKVFDFAQEAGISTLMAGLLIPSPGSEIYRRFKEEGRLLEDVVMGGNNTHFDKLAYIPDNGRNSDTIIGAYHKLLTNLYDKDGKAYFERCKVLLDNIQPGKGFTRKVGLDEIKMLGRSLVRQSFSSYGKEYLKFVNYARRSHPDKFPEAIRLAIMGHHFIQITKNQSPNVLQRYLNEAKKDFNKVKKDISEKLK